MKKTLKKRIYLGLIILLSIIGGAVAIYSTANGPWGGTDSVAYISSAFSLLHGRGLGYYEGSTRFTPLTWYPPLYSGVLSVIGFTGMNLVSAARWLNIVSFIASIYIAGWIFLRFSRVPAMGVIASALMCTFPSMLLMFSSAFSEPLFILLYLSSGVCLLLYLEKESPVLFVLSTVVLSLIPLTRYAGIAMLASGGTSLFLLSPGKMWHRLKKAALLASLGSLLTLLWFIWAYLVSNHHVGGRNLGMDWGILRAKFQLFRTTFLDIIWKWIPFQNQTALPQYKVRLVLSGIGMIGIIVLSFLALRKINKNAHVGDQKSDTPVLVYFGLSSFFYLAFLIFSYLFVLPTISIDNRMLLPLFVGLVMGLLGAFSLWQTAWFTGRRRIFQMLPWLVVILCVYSYLPQIQEIAENNHPGKGMTAFHWNSSELIQAVRALPASSPVISNEWETLMLWTQRPIYSFWSTFPSNPPIQTTAYGTNPLDHVQSVFCNQGAALVIFNDFPTQFTTNIGLTAEDSIPVLFRGLSIDGNYSDGTIYFCH